MTFPYRIRSPWHVLPFLGFMTAAGAAPPAGVVVVERDESVESSELRLDGASVPAGPVVFRLSSGMAKGLELTVERTGGAAVEPIDAVRTHPEGAVEMTLLPGDYVLICNSSVEGWTAMSEPFSVTL